MNSAATVDAGERLMGTKEVARRYGIHPKTVLRFVRDGRIPAPLKKSFGTGEQWRASVIEEHLRSLE